MTTTHAEQKKVPILITWDVDPSPEVSYEARKLSLGVTVDLCSELDIRSTFFITANASQVHSGDLERMQTHGHQIGCHGLSHSDEEEYDKMDEAIQRTYIEEATQKLESMAGTPIRVFRSPRVKISACTMKLLAQYGYLADSSVCSQRMDLLSSNLINPGWLFSPRLPYHPHCRSAFKRGDLPIWEIPLSAVGAPFISAFLSVLGLSFMKVIFRLLYAESRRTGKPIVYMAHPVEFTSGWLKPFTLKELSPSYIRVHGFLVRKHLYRMDPESWLNATRELFSYMASFSDVVFMSVGEYVTSMLGGVHSDQPAQV